LFKCTGPKTKVYIFIRFWKNKREQKNQQKGSLKRLKKSAHEVQSAPEVMTSSVRSVSSEARSPEAEVHQKMKNLKDSKSWKYVLIASKHCKRLREYNNDPWKGI